MLELAKETDVPASEMVDVQLSLALSHEKLQKYEEAIGQLEQVESEEAGLLIRKTCQMGRVYQLMSNYDRAICYYAECVQLLEQSGSDVHLLEKLLNKLGLLYLQVGKNKSALECLEKDCKLAKTILPDAQVAGRMFTLAEVQRKSKQWESALESYTVSMNYRKKAADTSVHLAKTQAQLAAVLIQIEKYEPAKDIINDAIKIYQDQEQTSEIKLAIAQLQLQLSECYKQIGEPEGGITVLQKCLETRKKLLGPDNSLTQQAYMTLISLFFLLDEQEKSLQLLTELKDSQEKSETANKKLVG